MGPSFVTYWDSQALLGQLPPLHCGPGNTWWLPIVANTHQGHQEWNFLWPSPPPSSQQSKRRGRAGAVGRGHHILISFSAALTDGWIEDRGQDGLRMQLNERKIWKPKFLWAPTNASLVLFIPGPHLHCTPTLPVRTQVACAG